MATTVFSSVKNGLIRLFKTLYPAFDVFCEEIVRTQEDEQHAVLEDYIFLDIIPTGNETISAYHTRRRILVDAAVHTKTESNSEYLRIIPEIDSALRPAFRFEDSGEAHAITVPEASFVVVDKVLHCTFTLAFTESMDELPPLPLMQELGLS